MAEPSQHCLILELPPDVAFLPAAAGAAENAARVFGLEPGGALRLSLAVEEFFTYLCRFAGREEPLRLTLSPGGSFVRMAFRFRAGEVSLRALNFAATVSLDDACQGPGGQDEDELGLLVASRTTDRCSLTSSGSGVYVVTAEVDRDYPELPPVSAPQVISRPVRLARSDIPPSPGQLQHAALLAAGRYPARACPASFFRPARFADMVASRQHQALLAEDSAGRPAGLICFRASGQRSVAFSGPYVFDDGSDPALRPDIARVLVEGFLAQVARTEALCAFSERPTRDVPPGWFERLGSLTLRAEADGEARTQDALFRHLREDAGGAVWAHADVTPFLEKHYGRLALSRDILRAEPTPAARQPGHSLLATALDRRRGLALLRPLLDGRDFAANLAAHVAALSAPDMAEGGPPDILLHLDLSEPWQAAQYPALADCGFAPRFILPHAGVSDLLVCQHVPAHR